MNITHHALLVKTISVQSFVVDEDVSETEVQDIYISNFGIKDARELVRKAFNSPVAAKIQCLVIRTDFITHEAQNALLKVLEEPPSSTRFIFVVPTDFTVLSTLASRFSLQGSKINTKVVDFNVQFKTLLQQSFKERLVDIDKAVKQKDLDWQRAIKQGLIQYISSKDSVKNKFLFELEYVARKLLTRGASNKMLLEHMSLMLTKVDS